MAKQYDCKVDKKLDSQYAFTEEQIETYKFSVKIEEPDGGASISRCSIGAGTNDVMCDQYKADKVVFDKNARITKYYVFPAQFDVQIFSDMSFIENNGRGGIAFGKCRVVSR